MKHFRLTGKKAIAALSAASLTLTAAPAAVFAGPRTDEVKEELADGASELGLVIDMIYGLFRGEIPEELAEEVDEALSGGINAAVDYTLTPGSDLIRFLNETGLLTSDVLDLSWFKSLSLTDKLSLAGTELNEIETLNLNGTDIASVNTLFDLETLAIYMAVPELFSGAVKVDLSALFENAGFSMTIDEDSPEAEILMKLLSDPSAYLPSGDEVAALITTYGDLVVDAIEEADPVDEVATVDGIAPKSGTMLELKITEEGLAKMLESILDTAKTDENIENIVKRLLTLEGETLEDGAIASLIDEVSGDILPDESYEFNPNFAITMKLYMDENDEMYGYVLSGSDEFAEIIPEVRVFVPFDGENFALDYAVTMEGEEPVGMSGKGTIKDGKANGEVVVTADQLKVFNIALEDVTSDEEAETLAGRITLTAGEDLLAMAEEDATYAVFTDSALILDLDTVGEEGTIALSVVCMGYELGTLSMTVTIPDEVVKADIDVDGILYDVTVEEDMGTILQTLDISGLLAKLDEAGAGEILNTIIGSMMNIAG